MSTTEGLWAGKLFKIKGGMWEKIVGPKINLENDGGEEKKNGREMKMKPFKFGEEKNKKEGNNDKGKKYETESEIGGGRIEKTRAEERILKN